MGWLDYVAPVTAAKRRAVIAQADAKARAYESSSKGRRTDGWYTTGGDANAIAKTAGSLTRNRARDLVANDPIARSMLRVLGDNIVGTGIVPRFENPRLQELFTTWAESENFECDSMGLSSFYALQRKVCVAVASSGGCFVRARARLLTDGLAVPFQLEILEDDHLDSDKTITLPNGGWVIQGVEFSPLGRVVAYWIFRQHPGSQLAAGQVSVRVDSSECVYVFDTTERPGLVRGVSWIAAAIIRLRDLDEMDDALIVQAKVAACFGAIITSSEETGDAGVEIEDGKERMTPGMIEHVTYGDSVTTLTPPTFNGYKDYTWVALHKACAAVGIPYELVFGDLMNVNFSSGRLGFTEFSRRVEIWQYQMMVPQFCQQVGKWFVQYAALAGVKGTAPTWTAQRRQMLDPGSDTAAVKDQVRAGLLPPLEALRQQGYSNPEGVLQEYADDWAKIDALGLVFDSDPRRVAAPGGGGLTPAPEASTTTKK